jgi:UDP-N-acetylmuramyl pentapeptide synthase
VVELSALEVEYNEYKETHKYSNEEYEALEVKCSEFEAELQTLREFKSNYDAAQLKAEKEAILNKEEYACLSEDEAFKQLASEVDNYSTEELSVKADLVLAAYAKATFSANKVEEKQTAMKFSIKSNDKACEKPYGGIFDTDN